MNRQHHLLALVLLALAGCAGPAATTPPPAPAATEPATGKTAETRSAVLKPPGEATIGDRTTCPTSGEEFTVSTSSPKVEYQGKTYYFCCGGCDAKFAKDPEKYLKKKPDA